MRWLVPRENCGFVWFSEAGEGTEKSESVAQRPSTTKSPCGVCLLLCLAVFLTTRCCGTYLAFGRHTDDTNKWPNYLSGENSSVCLGAYFASNWNLTVKAHSSHKDVQYDGLRCVHVTWKHLLVLENCLFISVLNVLLTPREQVHRVKRINLFLPTNTC